MVSGLDEDLANLKPGSKWSIKEHIGHLTDLEDLHRGRIDADAFFRRNHFTDGLTALVRSGFDRLSGRSGDGGVPAIRRSGSRRMLP